MNLDCARQLIQVIWLNMITLDSAQLQEAIGRSARTARLTQRAGKLQRPASHPSQTLFRPLAVRADALTAMLHVPSFLQQVLCGLLP
jgi:hypothetical protein